MSNSKFSDFTSEQRQQKVAETVRLYKNGATKEIKRSKEGNGIIYNENSPLDTRELFSGLKFEEARYASSKCRMEKAKSYFRSAKKYFKQKDYIAMLHYMHCSICNASRAMLDLKEEDDEQYIGVMSSFEKTYIQTKLFSENNFLFLKEICFIQQKIVRGDFFRMPKESFNEALTRVEIFLEDAEEVLSCYYMCTDKEIENSIGEI